MALLNSRLNLRCGNYVRRGDSLTRLWDQVCFLIMMSDRKGTITKGSVYPEPLGKKGASRASTDDIAEAMKIAVVDRGEKWDGKKS
jgi:hypothetical protein